MEGSSLSVEEERTLAELIEEANQDLEAAGETNASHAFNLGCLIALLPIVLAVALALIFSEANWVLASGLALLGGVIGLAFAALMANTARSKAVERSYRVTMGPRIETRLKEMGVPRPVFEQLAGSILPKEAVLRRFLPSHSAEDRPKPNHF